MTINLNFILGYCSIALIFDSCKTFPPDFFRHEIELSNQLGTVSALLPNELDTTYSWVNFSDCDCCDIKMYRFANSNYTLLKETGMFHAHLPDSLYQFTIFHKVRRNCDGQWRITQNSVDSLVGLMNIRNAEAFVGGDSIVWLNKERLHIDKRDFILLAYRSKTAYPYRDTGAVTILEAITIVDNEVLNFVYECSGINCEGFIEKMTISLKSIHIERNGSKKSEGYGSN